MILAFLWEMPQGDADFLRRLSLACSVPPTDDRPSGIVSAEKISSESLSILAPYKCLRDTIKGSSANDILLPGILGVIVLKSEDIEQGVSKKTLKPYTRSEIVLADGSWASCPVSLWNSQASLVQRLDVGDVILLENVVLKAGSSSSSLSTRYDSRISIMHRLVSDTPTPQDLKGFVNGWSPSLKKILEDLVLWADSQTTIQLYRAQRLTSKSGQIPTHHHIQKQSDSFVMTCTVCAIQADAVFDLCRSKYSLLTIDLFESLLRTICEACKTQNPWKNVSSPFVCLRCRHNSRLARIVPAEISLIVQLEQGPSSASQAIFALSLGLDSNHSTSSLQTPGQGGTPKTQKINGEYWLETLVPEMARWDSLTSEERLEQFSLFDDAIAVLLKSYTVQLLVYWMDGVLHLKNLVNRK